MAMVTILKRLGAGVMLAAVASGLARADADDDRIAALQAKYRCPIFEYLVAIHHAPLDKKHRFLTVEIANPNAHFTQCIFYNRDRKMHCEAESPFYQPELASYFTPARLALLKSLGYSTKASKDNFHLERSVPGIAALFEVAGLYVDTLARVFDLQIDDKLTYRSPLVPNAPQPSEETARYCAPSIS